MRSALVVCLLVGAAPAAAAELPPFDATHVTASFDPGATLWTDDSTLAPDGTIRAGIGLGYAHRPVALGPGRPELADVVALEFRSSYTRGRVRLATAMPTYPLLTGAGAGVAPGAGFGDMVFDGKLVLVQGAEAPVGVALGGRASLPTATVRASVGSARPTWAVQGIADTHVGPLRIAANAGYRSVPKAVLGDAVWDDHLFARVGAGLPVHDGGLSLDVGGRAVWGQPSSAGTPVEAVLGGWWPLGDTLVVRGGLGAGLTRGIGASRARGLVLLSWTPAREEPPPPRRPLVYVPLPDEPEPVPEPAPAATPAPEPVPMPAPRVRFAFDDATIPPEAAPELDAIAAWLAAHPATSIRVDGHADPRGGEAYNHALSVRRAQAVADALVARGIPRERLVVAGFGETRPLADAERSRRVDIVVSETVAAP